MDFIFPQFGFFLFILISAISLTIGMLSWYRHKEQQDLKAVELKILALENNLDYSEKAPDLKERLTRLGLSPGRDMKNLFSKQHETFKSYIFDASHSNQQGVQHKEYISVVCVVVELSNIKIPKFEINQKKLFDGISRVDNMKKIHNDLLPTWLDDSLSVFGHMKSSNSSIQRFFDGKEQLKPLLKTIHFHKFAGNGNILILFESVELKTSLSHLNQLEKKAQLLAQVFGEAAAQLSNDLDSGLKDRGKILKQSEKS